MNYSLNVLIDSGVFRGFRKRVSGLGIDAKFLENPAFDSVISSISNLIKDIKDWDSIIVREEDKNFICQDSYMSQGKSK